MLLRSGTPTEKKYAARISPVSIASWRLRLQLLLIHDSLLVLADCEQATPHSGHSVALQCNSIGGEGKRNVHPQKHYIAADFFRHMQALPIFLDRLVDPVTAVALSVTVVLFFGE